MVLEKRLDELTKIIKKEYSKELSDKDVSKISNGLVNYLSLLHKIKNTKDLKNK